MRIIADITDPDIIQKILDHIEAQPPPSNFATAVQSIINDDRCYLKRALGPEGFMGPTSFPDITGTMFPHLLQMHYVLRCYLSRI